MIENEMDLLLDPNKQCVDIYCVRQLQPAPVTITSKNRIGTVQLAGMVQAGRAAALQVAPHARALCSCPMSKPTNTQYRYPSKLSR